MPTRRDGVITEYEIRRRLANHYGGDNSSRDLVKNEREDSYGTVGSVVYSLNGSPPKGYAIHIPELRRVNLYDNYGKRFQILDSVSGVRNADDFDFEGDTDPESIRCHYCGRTHRELPKRIDADIHELDDGHVWRCSECKERGRDGQ